MESRAYKKSMESRAYGCCVEATNPKIMDLVELIKKANL
jgi:hypothetical protein